MVVNDCMGTKSNKFPGARETIFNFTRIEQVSRIEHFIFLNFTRGIEAKQPNSAIRKCARVQFIRMERKLLHFSTVMAA
ncbi:hypothetical protein ACS0TY_033913 [Phlomoides rotata]